MKINVLFLKKVALLKKRVKGVSDGSLPPEGEVPQSEVAQESLSVVQSPIKEHELEPEGTEGKQNSFTPF